VAGRHKFAQLRAQMSPAAQKRAAGKAERLSKEMDLAELRRARELSQEKLAQALRIGQAAVAKIEKRTDLYLSTLERVIRAMGGELRIVAHFANHDVRIRNFGELTRHAEADAGRAQNHSAARAS